jgi:hypothetical protein
MPYNFTPRSEEELMELAPEGEYDFIITASEERDSKTSGKRMAVITVKFYDENRKCHEIFDFLSYMSKMDWKIKHLCDSCGKIDKWASGIFNAEHNKLEGWKGIAKISVDKTGQRPKNRVKDYIAVKQDMPIGAAASTNQTPPVQNEMPPIDDNDIPF